MRDGKLTRIDGIVNLHPTAEGTPWVTYLKENHCFLCMHTSNINTDFILKGKGNLFFVIKYKIRKLLCWFLFSIFTYQKSFEKLNLCSIYNIINNVIAENNNC